MTPSVMGVTSYPSDDVSAADFSPDEDAEESRFYKGRYFSLRLKCQMIQQKNERALRRLSIVRKLVRRLNRQNKCLTLRLKKHDSRWRETKVVATWEAPDARLSDFSNAVLGSTLPESLVPAPHATGKTGLKFADFKTSHQIQTVTNSNNDKDSQILGSSNSILKTSNFPS